MSNRELIAELEAEVARLREAMNNETIERCAKVCEVMGFKHSECPEMSEYCADAIRALKVRLIIGVDPVTRKCSDIVKFTLGSKP